VRGRRQAGAIAVTKKEWLAKTEKDWLAAKTVLDLGLYRSASGKRRKWRLFGCACASRTLVYLPDPCFRSAIVSAEKFADGELTWTKIKQVRKEVTSAQKKLNKTGVREEQNEAIAAILEALAKEPLNALSADEQARYAFAAAARPKWEKGHDREERQQLALAYDIFPNPFRPIATDSAWLTSTVRQLADAIYEERAFDRLPILADALEDAGCSNAEILSHCRGLGPHVLGCWVVDLLLGRE
jgi:hypothetical protein